MANLGGFTDAYISGVVNLVWHIDPEGGYPISINKAISPADMAIVHKMYDSGSFPYKFFRGTGG
jgi:hypothetical protein